MAIEPYADNFIPVVPVDYIEHTEESPFCWNESCPCHEDKEEIAKVNQAIQDGLLIPEEATDFVKGRSL